MDESKKSKPSLENGLSNPPKRFSSNDAEQQQPEPEVAYPKSVMFIIGNEFCERFSYYGMRTILIFYLIERLKFQENSATMAFHVFAMACYFTPLLGAILADSYLGRYLTILIISCIYAAGSVVIALASIGGSSVFSLLGLALIALGTGGIKPCVSAFGGDQFLPSQEKQLQRFFSLFYIAINGGSLISTFLTPILREDVSCLGRSDCYPLAFGIPALLMLVSLSIFVLGKVFVGYESAPPQKDNVIIKVCHCVFRGLMGKFSSKPSKDHWLDYAEDYYDSKTISDVKALMRVLFLCIPLPIFWALFDQQSSRWTLQANKMNGKIGSYTIKPDQIQVVNPVMIVAFIPIFDYIIYPVGSRIGLKKPLRRMAIGGIMAGIAFLICGMLQMSIENEIPNPMESNHNHMLFINADKNPMNLDENLVKKFHLNSTIDGYQLKLVENVPRTKLREIEPALNDSQTLVFYYEQGQLKHVFPWENIRTKPTGSGAKMFTIFHLDGYNNETFGASETNDKIQVVEYDEETSFGLLNPFEIVIKGKPVFVEVGHYVRVYENLGQGSSYVQLITGNLTTKAVDFHIIQVVDENQKSVFLQIFQYIVITAAEILFSVTGLEFFYCQSPKSMKSVMQAAWLLTVSFGDLLVAVIADIQLFDKQSYEFMFFGLLMFLDMAVFSWMAYKYIPNDKNNNEEEER